MKTLVAAADPDRHKDVVWMTSSFCEAASCVRVAFVADGVLVRDEAGVTATFTTAEWVAFTAGVRNGEFDGPRT